MCGPPQEGAYEGQRPRLHSGGYFEVSTGILFDPQIQLVMSGPPGKLIKVVDGILPAWLGAEMPGW